jgi:hypothetical protein
MTLRLPGSGEAVMANYIPVLAAVFRRLRLRCRRGAPALLGLAPQRGHASSATR